MAFRDATYAYLMAPLHTQNTHTYTHTLIQIYTCTHIALI